MSRPHGEHVFSRGWMTWFLIVEGKRPRRPKRTSAPELRDMLESNHPTHQTHGRVICNINVARKLLESGREGVLVQVLQSVFVIITLP